MKKLMKILLVSILSIGFFACSQKEEEKVLDGVQGDVLKTMFYSYGINDAYFQEQIGDTITTEGKQFLIVDVTVINEKEESVLMADTDFYLTYGEDGRAEPLSVYGGDPLLEDELPREYTVEAASDKTGKLLFVVPLEETTFYLKAQDHYKTNESEEIVDGDTYSLSFTVEKKEGE